MQGVVLDRWTVQALPAQPMTIYPDGCRDVIWFQLAGQPPRWRLTPLDLTARRLHGLDGARMQGYRLRPGAVVAPDLLGRVLRAELPEDAADAIAELATVPADIAEVMAACADPQAGNVTRLAQRLGVTLRSLQRLTQRATGQGPLYWLRLCRLRQAFAASASGEPLAQAASDAGFADQAHFCREARAFHGESPGRLLSDPGAMRAILAPGL